MKLRQTMQSAAQKRIPARTGVRRESRDALWHAVQSRDSASDGKFVYAVRSTGIYCRPSCPSRKPRREHVVFFALPEAAEQHGFRPCRRCRPRSAPLRDSRTETVARVCREIDARILSGAGEDTDAHLTLVRLSVPARMSTHQLGRAFHSVMGITPRQYADSQRMRRLKSRLKEGTDVTTALYDAGYGSSSRLYERAPAHLGMTPAQYRQGGAGMRIEYTIVASPLGRLLVGATARGISAVCLGDSDARLKDALRKEYPHGEIFRDANGLRGSVEKILAHLHGHEPNLDLPTDVQATAFQRRVWEELRRIPYGATRTYSEVAKTIGRPSAIRAVARACAANPVALIVPCHRVVRENGNLGGYRWGIHRKQALLRRERRREKKER